jgi:Cu-Zn family superoxide dismutase
MGSKPELPEKVLCRCPAPCSKRYDINVPMAFKQEEAMTTRIAAGLALALFAWTAQAADITHYRLPEGFAYPEGIALEKDGSAFYTPSAEDGALIRFDRASGQARTVAAGGVLTTADSPFPGLLGLELDDQGRLWIAGGRTGSMLVVGTKDGGVVQKLQSPRQQSLINDVALASGYAYFTDSLNPDLWRVSTKEQATAAERWIDLTASPIQYTEGVNLNGIAATREGKALIVVQMNNGRLFRIDTATKEIDPIDAGGAALSGGDGLVLDGNTLYVVRQTENEIVTLELSRDQKSAKEIGRFKDDALMYPATAAKSGDELLVVNTQFNRKGSKDPQLPFEIVGIPLATLKGASR